MIENDASKVYEASPGLRKLSAWLLWAADSVPPKSLAQDMAFAKLQSRILSAAEAGEAQQAITLSAGGTWHRHVLDGHAQVTDRAGTECAMEDGHGVTARCNAGRRPALHVCSAERQ